MYGRHRRNRGNRPYRCYGFHGATGPTGATGSTGTLVLSECATARADPQTVAKDTAILYGPITSGNGNNITHTPLTSDFMLSGGQTYYVEFGVNGYAGTQRQGMIFAVMINQFATDGRATSSNALGTPLYNSAYGSYFVTVPAGKTAAVRIQNIGLDDISQTNSSISIIQITNN